MDKLEYDLQYTSGINRNDEALIVDLCKKPDGKEEEQQKAIDFSKKVIQALEEKMKLHNSEHSKLVKLYQLKSAFCKGARMRDKNSEPNMTEWGLARVELFLRISSGKIKNINLELEENSSYNSLMDIANHFTPSEVDFEKAKSDIETYDLDSHFDNVDELYIDEEPEKGYYWKDY